MKMSSMERYRLRLNRRCLMAIVMTIHCLSSLSSGGNLAMARSISASSAVSSHPLLRSPNVHRHVRIRRTSSDQRIAELEALMTLVNGRSTVAHGKLDPFLYGKRKRSPAADVNVIPPLQLTFLSRTRGELPPISSADEYDDALDEILNSIDDTYSPERRFTDDDG